MPEFKSKKDHAYEDWQKKEYCKIEIKVKGEILDSQICLSGIFNIWRWRQVGGNKEIKACCGNKQAVKVEILVEWSRSSRKTENS